MQGFGGWALLAVAGVAAFLAGCSDDEPASSSGSGAQGTGAQSAGAQGGTGGQQGGSGGGGQTSDPPVAQLCEPVLGPCSEPALITAATYSPPGTLRSSSNHLYFYERPSRLQQVALAPNSTITTLTDDLMSATGLDVTETHLVFADGTARKVYALALPLAPAFQPTTPLLEDINPLDLEIGSDAVYIVDAGPPSAILRAPLDGSPATPLVSDSELKIDDVWLYEGFVYYASEASGLFRGTISRVAQAGGVAQPLAEATAGYPEDVTVTPWGVYWAEADAVRGLPHGSTAPIDVYRTGAEPIYALEADAKYLFVSTGEVTGGGGGKLLVMNHDGSSASVLAETALGPFGSIAIQGSYVYVEKDRASIVRVPRCGCSD